MTDTWSKIPNELLVLSEAFNAAITNSNRAWLAAATLTIIAIGATTGDGNGPLPGVKLSGYNFFAALTLALSAINLRLCSVHSNMYEIQIVYHRYLRDIGAEYKRVSQSVTLKELAHRLSISAYNRFFPILFAVREDVREKIMNTVKPIFEAIYLGIPLVGMVIALVRCHVASYKEDIGATGSFLIGITTFFVLIQFFVSMITLLHAIRARHRLASEHGLK